MKRFFAACGLASRLVCGGSFGAAHSTSERAALTASFIDRRIQAAWNHAQVRPAPRVDDAGFLRRIYLDLTGAIPPAEVVTAFLAERAPDKRARAVDRLLESPAYAAHFTDYWEKLLLGRGFAGPQV